MGALACFIDWLGLKCYMVPGMSLNTLQIPVFCWREPGGGQCLTEGVRGDKKREESQEVGEYRLLVSI